jgi:ribose transport system ATP-binding protein
MMVGREISQFYSPHEPNVGADLLRVEDLGTRDRGARAGRGLSGVSFTLRTGEILGVGGLMGSGRTELLECLFGARPVDDATAIELGGAPLRLSGPKDAIRAGVAFVSEDRKAQGLVLNMSVGRNITLAELGRFTRLGFVRESEENEAAREYADKLRVKTPKLATAVGNLSGGNQQKVVLAKWLLASPKVLLLDEPTKGIDVAAKAEIYAIVKELASRGMGIVFVSSEMPELLSLSDRILVMREGTLAGALDRIDATEEKILELATTAGAAVG